MKTKTFSDVALAAFTCGYTEDDFDAFNAEYRDIIDNSRCRNEYAIRTFELNDKYKNVFTSFTSDSNCNIWHGSSYGRFNYDVHMDNMTRTLVVTRIKKSYQSI